ncbi:hypothetical protein [Pseudomonas aeruginosa]|uniref:hypothetical protein n=3 Tax=Pseudomonas TaxID=286 RepID=UPI0021130566|nr:hypothetical protein [Pseudomonas aeruginosa]MCT9627969.1 hypothetical protein [Pseudomonas aeruginosa]
MFSNIQALFLGFAYYAYFSTGCFFLLVLICMGIRKPPGHTRIQGAFLLTLHYARCYSLFLLLIVPLLFFLIGQSLQGVLPIDEYLQGKSEHALYFMVPFLALYLRCCLLPMKRFWTPSKSGFVSFLIVLLITQLAFTFNVWLPSVARLELQWDVVCARLMASDKLAGLSMEQRQAFEHSCLAKGGEAAKASIVQRVESPTVSENPTSANLTKPGPSIPQVQLTTPHSNAPPTPRDGDPSAHGRPWWW